MNFITCLSRVDKYDTILMMVDKFFKYMTFISTQSEYLMGYNLIHKTILVNCLFTFLGTKLNFFITFHPQINDQMKRVKRVLEDYLIHYVMVQQNNWVNLLDVVQFAHSIQYSRYLSIAYYFAKNHSDLIEEAREILTRAVQRMKKNDDQCQQKIKYVVID
ncbi:unnamed protein product [Spirodela intermedia]|uniref:Uncharacterized protein n=1 Tax=Spirodela intermedia TaxID=51605 RepID=A0A7I8L1R1_SPIIN|nr:unnamed protein product [Spirodela intermedia]